MNLHNRGLAVVHMLMQESLVPSQMSFCAHNIPQGQGKCYVDDENVACCVYVCCVHVCIMVVFYVSEALDAFS